MKSDTPEQRQNRLIFEHARLAASFRELSEAEIERLQEIEQELDMSPREIASAALKLHRDG